MNISTPTQRDLYMAQHDEEQRRARKASHEREQRTLNARIAAGVTSGSHNTPDGEQLYNALREHVQPMREQLRALNTEIERLRVACGSYYGCNLDVNYCTEYNTAAELANKLKQAIELLEGDL